MSEKDRDYIIEVVGSNIVRLKAKSEDEALEKGQQEHLKKPIDWVEKIIIHKDKYEPSSGTVKVLRDPEPTTTLFAIRDKVSGGFLRFNKTLGFLFISKFDFCTSDDKETMELLLDRLKGGYEGYSINEKINPDNLEIVQLNITATVVEGREGCLNKKD